VKAANGCNTSAAKTLTFTAAPVTPTSITGPAKPCKLAIVTYSVGTVYGASSYNWTVPTGWIIQSGQGTATVTVKTGTTAGNITVTAVSLCGNSGQYTKSISLGTCTGREGDIATTETDAQGLIDLQFFPNPVKDVLNISFASEVSGEEVNITLFDAMGRQVFVDRQTSIEGNNLLTLPLMNRLEAGVYVVQVQQGSIVKKSRILITKQ
jgi:hypothetical protein